MQLPRKFGFNPEFGRLGANPFGPISEVGGPKRFVAGPGIQVVGLGPLGTALIGNPKARAAVSDVRPFDVTVAVDPEAPDGDRLVTVQPGTVNNFLPTNMFTVGATPVSGTRYVTVAITFADGKVTAAALSMDTSAPDPTPVTVGAPPTSFKVLVAVIVDAVVFQIRRGNLNCTSTQAFITDKAAPAAPGELVYDAYWQWSVTTS